MGKNIETRIYLSLPTWMEALRELRGSDADKYVKQESKTYYTYRDALTEGYFDVNKPFGEIKIYKTGETRMNDNNVYHIGDVDMLNAIQGISRCGLGLRLKDTVKKDDGSVEYIITHKPGSKMIMRRGAMRAGVGRPFKLMGMSGDSEAKQAFQEYFNNYIKNKAKESNTTDGTSQFEEEPKEDVSKDRLLDLLKRVISGDQKAVEEAKQLVTPMAEDGGQVEEKVGVGEASIARPVDLTLSEWDNLVSELIDQANLYIKKHDVTRGNLVMDWKSGSGFELNIKYTPDFKNGIMTVNNITLKNDNENEKPKTMTMRILTTYRLDKLVKGDKGASKLALEGKELSLKEFDALRDRLVTEGNLYAWGTPDGEGSRYQWKSGSGFELRIIYDGKPGDKKVIVKKVVIDNQNENPKPAIITERIFKEAGLGNLIEKKGNTVAYSIHAEDPVSVDSDTMEEFIEKLISDGLNEISNGEEDGKQYKTFSDAGNNLTLDVYYVEGAEGVKVVDVIIDHYGKAYKPLAVVMRDLAKYGLDPLARTWRNEKIAI